MSDTLTFSDRKEFRRWLEVNCLKSAGVWLIFGKAGGIKTVKADEALEEALCFGWIDGQMQKIDDYTYIKYFSLRRPNSKWSDKNKSIVKSLEERGLMTDCGRAKIAEAKNNGLWDAPDLMRVGEDEVAVLEELLRGYDEAHANFCNMTLSSKKTYARAYFDAKTDAGRKKRIAWIVDRLNKNLKPM